MALMMPRFDWNPVEKEGHHRFLPQESGQLLFQLKVQLKRTVEKAGAGAAGAILLQRLKSCPDHIGVRRQTEVVV